MVFSLALPGATNRVPCTVIEALSSRCFDVAAVRHFGVSLLEAINSICVPLLEH